MCGLECDVCKQKLTSGDNTTPTICIFPCFHKYCERCKGGEIFLGKKFFEIFLNF